MTAETPAKKSGLIAGWDFGDTIRVVMLGLMVWLVIEAPETTVLGEPYATIARVAYYASLATVIFPPQFWARFGRRSVKTMKDTVILPGGRLFEIVTFLGLAAMTPQTLFWAIETPLSDPWTFGFYWFCVVVMVLAALVCLRNLLRSNDLLHLDAQGIAAPRLWQSVVPWSAIKEVRTIGSRSDNAVMLIFEAPTEVALKRQFLDWSVKLGKEKRSLWIPGILLGLPAEDVAARMRARIGDRNVPPPQDSAPVNVG